MNEMLFFVNNVPSMEYIKSLNCKDIVESFLSHVDINIIYIGTL